jgi:phosphoesterase RecJ-like protein
MYHYLAGSAEVMSPAQLHDPEENGYSSIALTKSARPELLSKLAQRQYTINMIIIKAIPGWRDKPYSAGYGGDRRIVVSSARQLSVQITPGNGNALYAGIVQDTGSFHHSNTRAETFRIAADLLECGVDLVQTRIHLFESKSRDEMNLLTCALHSMRYSEDGKMAWMTISYQEAEELGVLESASRRHHQSYLDGRRGGGRHAFPGKPNRHHQGRFSLQGP